MPVIREVYPYLIVHDAPAAIAFYRRVFGAEERLRISDPEHGRVGTRGADPRPRRHHAGG